MRWGGESESKSLPQVSARWNHSFRKRDFDSTFRMPGRTLQACGKSVSDCVGQLREQQFCPVVSAFVAVIADFCPSVNETVFPLLVFFVLSGQHDVITPLRIFISFAADNALFDAACC